MRRPLSVVGTDQEALRALLTLHAAPEPRILDVTHNQGTMWRGLPYRPVTNDIDPNMPTDHHEDLRALPAAWSGAFDVVVFDPPHLTHGGGSGVMAEWRTRYGLSATYRNSERPELLFEPFLREAQRVLRPRDGIVLAKLADQVHGGKYHWQARTFQNLAEGLGFVCCDLMIRVTLSRGSLIDPRWTRIAHTRSVHTYWLCLRNGRSCMSASAPSVVRETTAAMFEVSA